MGSLISVGRHSLKVERKKTLRKLFFSHALSPYNVQDVIVAKTTYTYNKKYR